MDATSVVSESVDRILFLAVVFGCGYVTIFAHFAMRNAVREFFDLNSFDKFFMSLQWGVGITFGSALVTWFVTPTIGFPKNVAEVEVFLADHLVKLLGYNCFFMALHHRGGFLKFIDNFLISLREPKND